MKSIKFVLVVFIIASITSCNSQGKKTTVIENVVEVVGAAEFSKLDIKTQLIDVRTPEEYSEGYIKHATNINFYEDNFMELMAELAKDEVLYIYCKSGGRSGKAAEKLKEAGFTKVYDLDGGILQWQEEGNVLTQNY
ncbi:MAG: rhodanese-like domain-containing protein [Urechidicola sp.]|nr:rhodanese-like domain-containing protein [Urechidicola sp.]